MLWALLLAANPYTGLIDTHVQVPHVIEDRRVLRRLSLDLRGRPPTPEERHAVRFTPRARVVDAWLAGDEAARYWAAVWAARLVQEGGHGDRSNFAEWLAAEFRAERPWSSSVAEMLTATGDRRQVGAASFLLGFTSVEEATGGVARLFLASSIQCAQCHDHPYQDYSVRDFYGLQAFLVRTRGRRGVLTDVERGHARMENGHVVYPRWPGGRSFGHVSGADRRAELARLVTAPSNRAFAKATVNRIWARYMGRGLVESLDDLADVTDDDRAGAALLDHLARRFSADGFGIRPLVAGILGSRAYRTIGNERMAFEPRPLNPEQLVLSVLSVTGIGARDPAQLDDRAARTIRFLHTTGAETSIPRVLTLMNGRALQRGFRARGETRLRRLIDRAPNAKGRIDQLFEAALARPPSARERAFFLDRLARTKREGRAYEDAFWALVSSAEFASHF